ncbi:hypothetical protein [Staphylococcus kloosii]|uniref:Uncharacterized protein n=1 Tax=Staphylococcus kloosii TaxID=29384 RepID=A0A151A4G8_9STAP|nr:hypothetical protein [Staphylococcus kloosii]KYH14242.1 hypothetical protein A0131_05555 [Staphylococcus kloosii]
MFISNHKNNDKYENEVNNLDELEQELLDEGVLDSEFFEELNGNLDIDFKNNENLSTGTTPRQTYSTILKVFFDDYVELSSCRDRFSAMIDIGIFDEESFEIIFNIKWQAEHTLKMYKNLMQNRFEDSKLLDNQCKNIDYRIRKSLELEINALNKFEVGIKENNQELAQAGLDENEKALNIISPILEDIQEIMINAFYE